MRTTELTISSINTVTHPKQITALVIEPDIVGSQTGVMLFTHGWRGNRFLHQDKMKWAADRYNVIAVSVEFRQSGYDFDSVHGRGSYVPYDASFYQVFDVLNVLRHVLQQRQNINPRRVYHYGGSQGGHIALLASIYAPATFAWIYVSCPLTHIDDTELIQGLVGRHFAPWELTIRSPLELIDRINCPVYLEYGTADAIVNHETHGLALAVKLAERGHLAHHIEYSGGTHNLTPTTTKLAAFQTMSEHLDWNAELIGNNDFEQGTINHISCGERTLVVDWSKSPTDTTLANWRT